ncbi:hypothetical protein [Mycoplasma parvum]|uniref:Uncharacterized protein n=1 Tax=Mycoplasma parvum str. Indiana TaxID=1403316 RepID=U5NBW2_9MOLU|nr:hypothetical protein [Mycoplasma parvum]AGX89056.1 hypothetical protein PRV_01495 [Mycoplasma parvum str. Indiana]
MFLLSAVCSGGLIAFVVVKAFKGIKEATEKEAKEKQTAITQSNQISVSG